MEIRQRKQRKHGMKKSTRYLSGAACLLFATAIGLSAKYFPVNAKVQGAGTSISYMPKTDSTAELGTEANPFTILEIVPNKSMGMVGYMIPGCEPVDMEALQADGDLSSDVNIDLIGPGLWASSEEGDNYRYAFADGLPEGAQITEDRYNYATAYGKWCKFENSVAPGYSEYGYYENVGEGNGTYQVTLGGENEIPVFTFDEGGPYTWVRVGYYYPAALGQGHYERLQDATGNYTFVPAETGNFSYQTEIEYEEEDTTQDLSSCYWTLRTDEIYYRYLYKGYYNLDAFVSGSIDNASSYDGFISQVITVTPDQLTDENLDIIQEADMIVISAQDYGAKYWMKHNKEKETLTEEELNTTTFVGANGNDLSWNAVVEIVNRMASESPAAMILEFSALCGDGGSVGYRYNIQKLYMMLMQYGAKPFKETFLSDSENFTTKQVTVDGKTFVTGAYRNDEMGKKEYETSWDAQTFMTGLGIAAMHESAFPQGQHEVFGTILTYNGDMSFLREYLNPTKIGEIKDGGNEWNKPGSNSELFDYYQDVSPDGSRPSSLSMQQGTYYILKNATGTAGYKKKLRVLEVQPCNEFIYGNFGWQLYYANLLPWFTGDLTKDLTVTTMTTYQLNGDITDLNSEYDLILFGAKQNGANGGNGYNDVNNMSGNLWGDNGVRIGRIYTSIGDLVLTPLQSWERPQRWVSSKGNVWSDKGSDAYQLGARYSGNDISKKKFEEMRDYLASGSPIVVSSALYDGNNVSVNRVDKSSYMYQLAALLGKENTLFKEGSYKDSNGYDRLKSAVSKENCAIAFSEGGYPVEYQAVTGDGTAYVKGANGSVVDSIPISGVILSEQYNGPILRYEFELEGDKDKAYGIKLYIDRNGDGIFSHSIKEEKEQTAAGKESDRRTSEEVGGLTIQDVTEETEMPVTDGTLLAGHRYVVTRTVPSSEKGILPWKLEIYDKTNDSIRCSAVNYTAVEASSEEKELIHVLQMNLMPDMKVDGDTYVNFADKTTATGAKFDAYLKGVNDFNVQISYMKNSDWYKEYGEGGDYADRIGAEKAELVKKWENYLEEIDMLIIGYRDIAAFTSDQVFYEGFMDFVNSGKSVILSHDLVNDATFRYSDPDYVTDYDSDIRTLAGQRRKYYVTTDPNSQNRNYYRYSATSVAGNSINMVPEIDMWKEHQGKPGHGGGKQPSNQSNKDNISGIYRSIVQTNIPVSAGNGYTKAGAGTYEKNGQTYYNDYGSEFMDNSVRLMEMYATSTDKLDRVRDGQPAGAINWPDSAGTTYIEIANQGQITNYPYKLGDVMEVSYTHAQNFQLDLEQEDGGDVTVWFNLTDKEAKAVNGEMGTDRGVYSSRDGDSANNYYIYTKGNITYTGMGHTNKPLTDDEVKLFVNTMISAYRAVPGKPYVKVTNTDASESNGTYTMYVMLTGAEKDGDFLPVDFTVVEESLTEGNRSYYLQYLDAEGNALTDQIPTTTKDGSRLDVVKGENRYQVQADGNYSFNVPYSKIKNDGEAVYYLDVNSVSQNGAEVTETHKTTKVVVYAMPLFSLH